MNENRWNIHRAARHFQVENKNFTLPVHDKNTTSLTPRTSKMSTTTIVQRVGGRTVLWWWIGGNITIIKAQHGIIIVIKKGKTYPSPSIAS